jgi:hypothetical protein
MALTQMRLQKIKQGRAASGTGAGRRMNVVLLWRMEEATPPKSQANIDRFGTEVLVGSKCLSGFQSF